MSTPNANRTVPIKHWYGRILFECEIPAEVESTFMVRHALEKATAQRPRIDLSGADLSGAVLRGAVLRGAVLRGAVLRGADGKPLPRATPEEAIANLDKVREIVLDNAERLNMGHWHDNEEWRNRTCAEEVLCGTTHCMAGWLQVCTTEPALKNVTPHVAGIMAAPIAAKMFFSQNGEALDWLRDRKYAAETEEAEHRSAERKARRAAEGGVA